MSSINISQEEAIRLIEITKEREDNCIYNFPGRGVNLSIPIISEDKREKFFLDIHRGNINLKKITNQMRAHQAIILVRIDFDGKPHTNPDGTIIQSPHIHIYREGYNDKWAEPLPSDFTNPYEAWKTLYEFMDYCNIVKKPHFHKGIE